MAGTKIGGAKAAQTARERYGDDYYARIGRKGGSVSGIAKGFALNPEKAAEAGRRGGKVSKRGLAKAKAQK